MVLMHTRSHALRGAKVDSASPAKAFKQKPVEPLSDAMLLRIRRTSELVRAGMSESEAIDIAVREIPIDEE